jgi:hypothetical protein
MIITGQLIAGIIFGFILGIIFVSALLFDYTRRKDNRKE